MPGYIIITVTKDRCLVRMHGARSPEAAAQFIERFKQVHQVRPDDASYVIQATSDGRPCNFPGLSGSGHDSSRNENETKGQQLCLM